MNQHTPNPKRQEILDLARTGLSGGQIAKTLGVTRNTVIGICWRSGVPLGDQEASYRAKLAWWEKQHRDARIHRMQVDLLTPAEDARQER